MGTGLLLGRKPGFYIGGYWVESNILAIGGTTTLCLRSHWKIVQLSVIRLSFQRIYCTVIYFRGIREEELFAKMNCC